MYHRGQVPSDAAARYEFLDKRAFSCENRISDFGNSRNQTNNQVDR
jgi:hypothetical protein